MGVCTFSIEVRRADGALAGVVDASLGSCIDDAWLRGVQAGELPNDGSLPPLRVVPVWHGAQRPAIRGVSLSLAGCAPRHYPREVFATDANALVQRLLGRGQLEQGEKVHWNVVAREAEPVTEADTARTVRTQRAPFPLQPASLPHAEPGSFEVAIEAGVLRGLRDRIGRTRDVEGAELLVGDLLHDAGRRALELRVLRAFPLEPGVGGSSNRHFAFDHASVAAARRRALEREGDAVPCGWHHDHPPLCEGCWKQPECRAEWVFFSSDDREVHATLFSSPQMVALVGGKLSSLPATRPGFRLYGWRDGVVVERGFRVFGAGAESWDSQRRTFRDEAAAGDGSPKLGIGEEISEEAGR